MKLLVKCTNLLVLYSHKVSLSLGSKKFVPKAIVGRRLLFDEFFLTNFLLGPGNLPKINLYDSKIILNPANCRKICYTNFRLPNLAVPAICRIFLPDKDIDRGHSALFKIVNQHFQEGQGEKGKSSP